MDRAAAYELEQLLVDELWGNPRLLNTVKDVRNPITEHLKCPEVVARQRASLKLLVKSEAYKENHSVTMRKAWAVDGRREARTGAGNPFAKQVSIDGVVYGSVKEAHRLLKIDEKTIRKRANLPQYLTYEWVTPSIT